MRTIFFIITFFILTSCNEDNGTILIEDDEATLNSFNATVLSVGIDCGDSFLIKFNDDVENLPENNFDNVFYEINLPIEYKVEGLQINVTFREPTNEELMICSSFGFLYPQIFIVSVD